MELSVQTKEGIKIIKVVLEGFHGLRTHVVYLFSGLSGVSFIENIERETFMHACKKAHEAWAGKEF